MKIIPCKNDGFPSIIIDNSRQCVAEYLNRCIGHKKITDVVTQDNGLVYIFENGHELPIFCYCCDTPIEIEDLAYSKEKVLGRHLHSMSWDYAPDDNGEDQVKFFLELAKDHDKEDDDDYIVSVSTSLKSAQKLIHPEICASKKLLAPRKKEKKIKKKRKRHKSKQEK